MASNIIDDTNVSLNLDTILFDLEQSPVETITVEDLSNDDKEFYDILQKWSYFIFLKESGVTLNNVKYLRETDIVDIFGKSIGARAQFRALVNKYRKINNLPPLNSLPCCCQNRGDNTTNNRILQNIGSTDSTKS